MSPHFGLLDEAQLSREEAMLMRAKLHWRCGKRRILEGKTAEGIATLYDALLSSMRWHVLTNYSEELGENAEEKLEDDETVIALLRRAGVLAEETDLHTIEETVNQALLGEDIQTTGTAFLDTMAALLTTLGLLPFDESELPPEDPGTF